MLIDIYIDYIDNSILKGCDSLLRTVMAEWSVGPGSIPGAKSSPIPRLSDETDPSDDFVLSYSSV